MFVMKSEIQKAIRNEAKRLLEHKRINLFIGYCEEDNRIVPCFISSPEETEKLVWNNRCKNNLAIFLREERGKIGIIAKGCDSRAILELLKTNQISREDLVIVGVPCEGMIDEKGKEYENCKVCLHKNPTIYDIFLGEMVDDKSEAKLNSTDDIESLSLDERFEFWKGQFQKCIKCMACRNVCPLCFCNECFVDKNEPKWIEKPKDISDIFLFHIIKAFHMIGRCVECGECERACPVGIPLMKLYHKISRDVRDMFNYESGMNEGDKLPLVDFDIEKDTLLEKNEGNEKN